MPTVEKSGHCETPVAMRNSDHGLALLGAGSVVHLQREHQWGRWWYVHFTSRTKNPSRPLAARQKWDRRCPPFAEPEANR